MVAKQGWRVATVAVLALSGVLFLASGKEADGRSLRPDGQTELIDLVRAASYRSSELTQRVESLQDEIDELTAAQKAPALDEAQAAVDGLRPEAGLTPVTGPGLQVTLDDAPLPGEGESLPPNIRPDDLVVHQQDLEGVINALWAGGAEAMMIMDQRIVSTSAVRCVGSVLILHGRVYSPPYTVTAIGDISSMRRALDESDAVQTYLGWANEVGLGYDVKDLDEVMLPEYGGSLELRHAVTTDQ